MNVFSVTDEQMKKIYEWETALVPGPDTYCGAIGGRFTYSFTNTGIGTVITVKDGLSGDVIDVTDYEDW